MLANGPDKGSMKAMRTLCAVAAPAKEHATTALAITHLHIGVFIPGLLVVIALSTNLGLQTLLVVKPQYHREYYQQQWAGPIETWFVLRRRNFFGSVHGVSKTKV